MLANDWDSLWDNTLPGGTDRRTFTLVHRYMKPRLPRGLRTANPEVVDMIKSSLDVFNVRYIMEEDNARIEDGMARRRIEQCRLKRLTTTMPMFARHEVALFGLSLVAKRIQCMVHAGRTNSAHWAGDDACTTDLLQMAADMFRYRFEDVMEICTVDDLVDHIVDTMSLHIGVDVSRELVGSYVCHVAPHAHQPCELLRMAFLSCDCIAELVGHTLAKTLRSKLAHEW